MITLLNTSILTNYGDFQYSKCSLEDARSLIFNHCPNCQGGGCPTCSGFGEIPSFSSAIGHESTAEILTELLGIEVKMNRQMYKQDVGDTAVVFKLNGRPEEGKILSRNEIEEIGYEFGILKRSK